MNPTRHLSDDALVPPSREQPTPALRQAQGHPSEEGTCPHPLPGGVAGGRSGFLLRQAKRWVACRRGTVALEGAIATIPLVFCLAGMFEIVQTVFTGDLLQRAAYRVARANAMSDTAASDAAALENRVTQAINAEIGDLLDFKLTMNGTCGESEDEGSNTESDDAQTADYCLIVQVEVYNSPCDMFCALKGEGPGKSQGSNAELGGDAGDMVVVRMQLQPQSALNETLGTLQQKLFGDGLRAVAVMRNERI